MAPYWIRSERTETGLISDWARKEGLKRMKDWDELFQHVLSPGPIISVRIQSIYSVLSRFLHIQSVRVQSLRYFHFVFISPPRSRSVRPQYFHVWCQNVQSDFRPFSPVSFISFWSRPFPTTDSLFNRFSPASLLSLQVLSFRSQSIQSYLSIFSPYNHTQVFKVWHFIPVPVLSVRFSLLSPGSVFSEFLSDRCLFSTASVLHVWDQSL